jgi:hypothetical protein
MQEKGHAARVAAAPQLGADVHQLVVVNPHEIPVSGLLEHRFGEASVHLQVGLPVGRREVAQRRPVVEQRPDHFVREAVIEVLDLVFAERNGVQRELVIVGVIEHLLHGFVVPADPGPADPGTAPVTQDRQHRSDQPAAARRRAVTAVGLALNHVGQAVRDDHQPAFHRLHSISNPRVVPRHAVAPATVGRRQVSSFICAGGTCGPHTEVARVSHPEAKRPVGQRLQFPGVALPGRGGPRIDLRFWKAGWTDAGSPGRARSRLPLNTRD